MLNRPDCVTPPLPELVDKSLLPCISILIRMYYSLADARFTLGESLWVNLIPVYALGCSVSEVSEANA
jgi:hypothetical protein